MPHHVHHEATESTETLVNPLPPVKLVITRPHPLVSALLLKGRPRFMISTIDPAGAKTIISDPRTKEVLVKIRRRIFFSDEITFSHHEGGKTMKIGKEWLKESQSSDGLGNDSFNGWDIKTSSGSFFWRTDDIHALALCPVLDMDSPIAWLSLPSDSTQHLLISPLAEEKLWDIIVGGWVALEQHLVKSGGRAARLKANRVGYTGSAALQLNVAQGRSFNEDS